MRAASGTKEKQRLSAAAFEAVLSVFYPRRCPLCGEIVTGGQYAHPACLRKAPYIRKGCAFCGRELPSAGNTVCGGCAQICGTMARPHMFVRNYAAFAYEGAVKRALYGLKYKNKKEYAVFFAREALRLYGWELSSLQIGAVAAVPLHKKRERARGYNQAACIGVHIAKWLGVPFEKRLVRRVRNTAPLKALGAGERSASLRDAFRADERAGMYRCILIVDDIYTTGSTLDAVSEALLAAGCGRIYTLTAAAAGADSAKTAETR